MDLGRAILADGERGNALALFIFQPDDGSAILGDFQRHMHLTVLAAQTHDGSATWRDVKTGTRGAISIIERHAGTSPVPHGKGRPSLSGLIVEGQFRIALD